MTVGTGKKGTYRRAWIAAVGMCLAISAVHGQAAKPSVAKKVATATRPKLVVMIVVDQMRADYVDKFRNQWKGGLKRLLDEGAWFRAAAFPYSSTETCPGHATISTGSFPATHGMVANGWWERDAQAMVTCTSDPSVQNLAYAGGTAKGGDSPWRLKVPAFAEELRYQQGGKVGVVALSLKARGAIMLAGHFKGDAEAHETVLWFDPSTGSWLTSETYGTTPFAEEYLKRHPVKEDYGKTWSLSLPKTAYRYGGKSPGAGTVEGWDAEFPHPLHGKVGTGGPDEAFFHQWETSPFADAYLTRMAEAAVTTLELSNTGETDYLGIGYSTLDHVGHTFGPRSWEVQDCLARLDQDLGELFSNLDQKVGRGNYVVALSADHGVAAIPADMQSTGFDAGVLVLPDLKARMEKALEPFNYVRPAIARIQGNELYFANGVYGQLKQDPAAMRAVLDAALTMPGVAAVYRADELGNGTTPISATRKAAVLSFFPGRSGDLFVLQQPYWILSGAAENPKMHTGTGHGTPYAYDQRVPILLMGFGIQHGEYFGAVTPADIAPTLGALTGVTLSTHDGRILSEALKASGHR